MLGAFQRDGDGVAAIRFSRLMIHLGTLALVLALLLVVTIAARGPMLSFGDMFIVDDYAVFFKVLVLLASALCLLISQEYLELRAMARFEYIVLVLLATTGMMLMISANDFMALYLGLEMQSLALYVIASFHRDEVRSVEAGLKYFVLGALASGMLLYGASLIYGYSGTTGFIAVQSVLGDLAGGDSAGRSDRRTGLRHRRPGLQGFGGAVPHVDSRTFMRARRRRSPRSFRWRRSSRRWRCWCG